MKHFKLERDGQEHFYKEYLPLIDKELTEDDVLLLNTDGVVNGNLLEFKLNIENLNKTLFQAIKYLSKMRINGESVPKNILLISLNTEECYMYYSDKYLTWIEQQYFGGASTNNDGFIAGDYEEKIDYSTEEGSFRLLELLREEEYIKINIDESCIVAWAERYYREFPGTTKGDFIGDVENKVGGLGEIREPLKFKDYIYPYQGKSNEKFAYLLDKLNDKLTQKETGAFYTPKEYAEKAAELVQMAIDRVPEGNDYVIIDACAGTGNLEEVLPDEVLKHCMLSTYEYYEYRVLVQKLGSKVKYIVPPTESQIKYHKGFITNADAMSEEFINNPVIKRYIDDPKMTIIMYENPPYRDSSAESIRSGENMYKNKQKSFVFQEMEKEKENFSNSNISTVRDLSNQFIWRAFKNYLRQPTDSYVVFSPVKYYKSLGIINKKFVKGFAFNRKHFHASQSVISCILWANEDVDREEQKEIKLTTYDITKDKKLKQEKDLIIKTVNEAMVPYYDKRELEGDIETNVFSENTGHQTTGRKTTGKSYYNNNIIGYMQCLAFAISQVRINLTRQKNFNARGFYLRSDNYLEKLPLFVAKLFPQDNWYDRDIYFTTSDGGTAYTEDADFLKSCLFYTCLSNQNKCLSFTGSDGRYYNNELCFDEDTLASKELEKYELNKDEEELMKLWNRILKAAKKTDNYNEELSYGVYQITQELDTSYKDERNKTIYNYPELHGDLKTLQSELKKYYKKYITDKMLKYQLVK